MSETPCVLCDDPTLWPGAPEPGGPFVGPGEMGIASYTVTPSKEYGEGGDQPSHTMFEDDSSVCVWHTLHWVAHLEPNEMVTIVKIRKQD